MMIKVITYLLLMQKVDGISVSDSLDGLKKVQPVIGSDIFDVVVDYGAVGDGKTDDTDALQAALDDCAASRNGGGIIKLLKGYEFLSLPLTLSGSGCALKIEGKLTQKFWQPSMSQGDIPEAFITVSDGVSDFLIYGGGIINGNGPTWWNSSGDTYANRPKLLDAKATNVALYDIQFYNSANHNLEMYCDNTEIAFVNITVDWDINDGDAPNTDGIDVHGAPFYIHDCIIDVGDDNIAIHASDLLVENCVFGSEDGPDNAVHGHGVSIGSIGSNIYLSNITLRNSIFKHTHVGPNCKIHSDATNGHIHDVLYENLIIDSAQLEGLRINVEYSLSQSQQSKPFVLNDFTYKNITMINTDVPGTFVCSDQKPCLDMHFIHITAQGNSEDDWSCSHLYGTQDSVSPKICVQSGFPSSYSYSFSYPVDDTYQDANKKELDTLPSNTVDNEISYIPETNPRLRSSFF